MRRSTCCAPLAVGERRCCVTASDVPGYSDDDQQPSCLRPFAAAQGDTTDDFARGMTCAQALADGRQAHYTSRVGMFSLTLLKKPHRVSPHTHSSLPASGRLNLSLLPFSFRAENAR
jgi:hypothetical protein